MEVLALILAHKWSGSSQPSSEKASSNGVKLNTNGGTASVATSNGGASNGSTATDGFYAVDGFHPTSEKNPTNKTSSGEVPSGEEEMSEEEEEEEGGDDILCLCGAVESEPGDSLVQCERCSVWQHIRCSGYSEEEDGEVFVCTRCLLKDVCVGDTTYCDQIQEELI